MRGRIAAENQTMVRVCRPPRAEGRRDYLPFRVGFRGMPKGDVTCQFDAAMLHEGNYLRSEGYAPWQCQKDCTAGDRPALRDLGAASN